jgi:hypothetical protein
MSHKLGWVAAAFASAIAISSPTSSGADIVYDVNLTLVDVQTQNGSGIGTVTGTITTDGRAGILSDLDITSWDLTLSHGSAFGVLQPGNSVVTVADVGLTTDLTGLFFDFGSSTSIFGFSAFFNNEGFLLFEPRPFSIEMQASTEPPLVVAPIETGIVQIAQVSTVPGPIVGAGLPGLILACGILLALARHRHKSA